MATEQIIKDYWPVIAAGKVKSVEKTQQTEGQRLATDFASNGCVISIKGSVRYA